jgi:hypothetical protein
MSYKTNGQEIIWKKKIAVNVAGTRQESAVTSYFIDRLLFLLSLNNDSGNEFQDCGILRILGTRGE